MSTEIKQIIDSMGFGYAVYRVLKGKLGIIKNAPGMCLSILHFSSITLILLLSFEFFSSIF